jgi:hypothetical protein
MQCAKLMLVLLGFAATLSAADPVAGTWKMNPAKAKYRVGKAPKQLTLTITEAGSDLNVKIEGIAADESKISFGYTIPAAGGKGSVVVASPFYDGVFGKRLGPNERVVSYMKGGKAVFTVHAKVSADGSTLALSSKGLSAWGQTVDSNVFYNKQ